MSYKVKDLTHFNREVTMPDGFVIRFFNQEAVAVPDKYIDYFRKISDFNVGMHTPEEELVITPPAAPVVESKPVEDEEEATTPVVEEEKSEQETEQSKEEKGSFFTKVTGKK